MYAWGKNDRGQMGTGAGMGIDLVESENVPTLIEMKDLEANPTIAKRFAIGQNTMMIQDSDGKIYITGLKIHYSPY